MSGNGEAMNTSSNLRSGGRILVDQLRIHGVEYAFGVPGESYLAVLDGLYDVPEPRPIRSYVKLPSPFQHSR